MISTTRCCLAAMAVAMSAAACNAPARTSDRGPAPRWANEPAGLVALTDQPWNAMVDPQWRRRPSSNDRIVEDADAPFSPRAVLEYVYPEGFVGGTAPATHYVTLQNAKEVFIGLHWKPSQPWHGHSSGVNKVQFVYLPRGDAAMVMYGNDGGPYELRVMPQWKEHTRGWLMPSVSRPVQLGTWHRIEWHLKYETRPAAGDGVIEWWLDGTRIGSYTDLHFPSDTGFAEYQISPTWGGLADTKRQADWFRFDHAYLSVPATSPR